MILCVAIWAPFSFYIHNYPGQDLQAERRRGRHCEVHCDYVRFFRPKSPTSVFAEVDHPLLKSTPTRLTWLCRLYFPDRRLLCRIFPSPCSKSIVKPSPRYSSKQASLPRSRRSETLITGFHNKEGLIRLNTVVDWSAFLIPLNTVVGWSAVTGNGASILRIWADWEVSITSLEFRVELDSGLPLPGLEGTSFTVSAAICPHPGRAGVK